MKASKNGVFSPFESLGMSAAFFRDEKHRDEALNELNDEFEFVPDFLLSLPLRVTATQFRSNRRLTPRTAREWPAASGVAQAHADGVLGADVLVAVLDTGVDADHAEFARRRINFRYISQFPNNPNWPPRDVRGFDANGHGTHVCGILAGQSVGVAPEAELYVATVIESESTVTSATRVVAGLQWVLRQFTRPDNERKPGVLSMSLGFPPNPPGIDGPSTQLRYQTMRLLIQSLQQANVLPVVAIGNSGAGQYGYPGALDEVIAVGAVDFQGTLASFSGSTPAGVNPAKPDLVGYGVGVDSAMERDYDNTSVYQRMSGTSMATPYVAGIAALYRSDDPALSVDAVQQALYASVQKVAGPRGRVGRGLASY
jgi:subtilisin family serine protease